MRATVAPPRKGSLRVMPRHRLIPSKCCGPSWGWSWRRTTEWMPSQATAIDARAGGASSKWTSTRSLSSTTRVQWWDIATGPTRASTASSMTPVELGAVDRVVRDVVAGAATARLGVDALPMPREERVLLLFYRDQSPRVLESEVVQPADRVREEVEPHAEGAVGGHALIDPAVDAGAFELQCEAQPPMPPPITATSIVSSRARSRARRRARRGRVGRRAHQGRSCGRRSSRKLPGVRVECAERLAVRPLGTPDD
jgi:hypothetical protein